MPEGDVIMAARAPRPNGQIHWLSPEEGREFFDRQARELLGISGEGYSDDCA